jgi:hypothetical protein
MSKQTIDGKNRNPKVFNQPESSNSKMFEISRLKQELDDQIEDEIDNYEGK